MCIYHNNYLRDVLSLDVSFLPVDTVFSSSDVVDVMSSVSAVLLDVVSVIVETFTEAFVWSVRATEVVVSLFCVIVDCTSVLVADTGDVVSDRNGICVVLVETSIIVGET